MRAYVFAAILLCSGAVHADSDSCTYNMWTAYQEMNPEDISLSVSHGIWSYSVDATVSKPDAIALMVEVNFPVHCDFVDASEAAQRNIRLQALTLPITDSRRTNNFRTLRPGAIELSSIAIDNEKRTETQARAILSACQAVQLEALRTRRQIVLRPHADRHGIPVCVVAERPRLD